MNKFQEWKNIVIRKLHQIPNLFSESWRFIKRHFSKFSLNITNPAWICRVFLIFLIILLVGGRVSTNNGPFDSPFFLGLESISPITGLMLICWLSILVGYLFSQEFTYSPYLTSSLQVWQILLILLLFLVSLSSYRYLPNATIAVQLFGVFLIISLGLIIGITTGDMNKPPWLGDMFFKHHIKKEMIKKDIYLLHCSVNGKMKLYDPKYISVKWDESSEIVKFKSNGDTLSNYAPVKVAVRSYDSGKQFIEPAFSDFSDFYNSFPPAWRDILSEHHKALSEGNVRMGRFLMLRKTIPYSPSTLALRSDLLQNTSYSLLVDKDFSGETSYTFDWPSPIDNLEYIFQTKNETSVINSILGEKDSNDVILDFEREFISNEFPQIMDTDAPLYFTRSFSHLMLLLRKKYLESSGQKEEICRLTINYMGVWFKSINQHPEIFPRLQNPAYKSLSGNMISIELWDRALHNSITQPTTQFLRLHDKMIKFIADDVFSYKQQEFVNLIIDDSIESALHTSMRSTSDSREEKSEWLGVGRRGITVNRSSALLSGVCKLMLIVSLYDGPESGVA